QVRQKRRGCAQGSQEGDSGKFGSVLPGALAPLALGTPVAEEVRVAKVVVALQALHEATTPNGAPGKGAGGGGSTDNGSGGAGGAGSGGVVIAPGANADGLPFCAGFKVSAFGCDEVTDLEKCPTRYTVYTVSAGRHLQCGVSGQNCLAIGPFCGE
ncbi:unnamed protein product, partial [Effrenium voratum]